MTKKAKQDLEAKLTQHVNKKYHNTIERVRVVDKNTCVITVEVGETRQLVDITLPIETLGYQV